MKKYKIDYHLEQLPKKEYDTITRKLTNYLGISKRTFDRWRNIQLDDSAEIPVDKMFLIALLFKTTVEEMFTQKPEQIFIEELDRHSLERTASHFGFSK